MSLGGDGPQTYVGVSQHFALRDDRLMRQAVVMVIVALVAACTGPTGRDASSGPSVEPTTNDSPVVIPPEALPVPEPSPWPIRPGLERARPTSSDVAIGKEKFLELYTHCGIDFDVDFDGSFWQLYPDSKTRGLGTSFQIKTGTMTLLSDQVAVFHFEHHDEQRAVYFVRNDSPKPLGSCA